MSFLFPDSKKESDFKDEELLSLGSCKNMLNDMLRKAIIFEKTV